MSSRDAARISRILSKLESLWALDLDRQFCATLDDLLAGCATPFGAPLERVDDEMLEKSLDSRLASVQLDT